MTKDLQYWIREGQKMTADRQRRIRRTRDWKFDTIAVHGLYDASTAHKSHSGSVMEPVYLSTAQAYENSAEMEAGLSYQMPTWCYTRIANPSIYFLEETIALLEGYGTDLETSGLATSSGMSAIRTATDPFLMKDDSLPPPNFVASAKIYGGAFQQFRERRFREQGIEVRWVTAPSEIESWAEKIDAGTRFLYGEFPSNPSVDIFDIESVSDLAHSAGVPLIVDATCASPALTRPLAFGADIVIQSATKLIATSGTTIAGLIVSRKGIPSKVGTDEMKADFATWVKLWPFRDNGPALHPMGAILILNDMRTLRLRIKTMSESALKVARWLEEYPEVDRVHYPGLSSYHAHDLARKYMQLADTDENQFGYLMAFEVREQGANQSVNTRKFYDALEMIWRATDLGRVKSVATLNAISTHQQQGEEGRKLASVKPNTVRLSIGLEDPADIIADLERALKII
ncbi:MAG: O-acetylhomoserine aminocarboxypropyltransferase/cysteine synthase [FCB group bacterium]|nr:O-acetylhomoserine aminocarboxypropyltransferase/cysteine synthase [FCB group bacterium]